MATDENRQYKPTAADEHPRNGDYDWTRILKATSPARSMLLLHIQRACMAFHQLDSAWKSGAVKGELLDFFRELLAMRVRQVLATMKKNGLDKVDGAAQLAEVLKSIKSAKSADDLAQLSEKVYMVNNLLPDSLEER